MGFLDELQSPAREIAEAYIPRERRTEDDAAVVEWLANGALTVIYPILILGNGYDPEIQGDAMAPIESLGFSQDEIRRGLVDLRTALQKGGALQHWVKDNDYDPR